MGGGLADTGGGHESGAGSLQVPATVAGIVLRNWKVLGVPEGIPIEEVAVKPADLPQIAGQMRSGSALALEIPSDKVPRR
ncbi:MAG: hypothetical protein CMO30_19370 [Tistrella sp.]|uniref:Uncharacterized protein n=1 Tax=Tistrella mobilis TaxID=171437 RepID=A0A3B9IS62_9PROT|nr:hypothetical protein [Tistrella sp.]MBA77435.1 hypothetical protein [Tistrella sp.]HAE50606.1 hypothetical protein [Tistrella mobilis]